MAIYIITYYFAGRTRKLCLTAIVMSPNSLVASVAYRFENLNAYQRVREAFSIAIGAGWLFTHAMDLVLIHLIFMTAAYAFN